MSILACPYCHSSQVEEIGYDIARCKMCDENIPLDEAELEGQKWNDEATQKGY
jgi:ribosomal protein L37AE/L43A